ncbi:MAG: hypothetical protein CJBNEKGG_03223 [Prosthecobacter sp.]|nr:hypothetical protein [Prosthecobacter sp.]
MRKSFNMPQHAVTDADIFIGYHKNKAFSARLMVSVENGVSVQLLDKCVPLAENGAWHAASYLLS